MFCYNVIVCINLKVFQSTQALFFKLFFEQMQFDISKSLVWKWTFHKNPDYLRFMANIHCVFFLFSSHWWNPTSAIQLITGTSKSFSRFENLSQNFEIRFTVKELLKFDLFGLYEISSLEIVSKFPKISEIVKTLQILIIPFFPKNVLLM